MAKRSTRSDHEINVKFPDLPFDLSHLTDLTRLNAHNAHNARVSKIPVSVKECDDTLLVNMAITNLTSFVAALQVGRPVQARDGREDKGD